MSRPADRFSPTEARVVMLTRVDCHLCQAALAVIEQVCAETGSSYATRDVDADPDLRARYTDEVPVTFVDGQQHDFWRVDADRLRAALSRSRPR
jgi:glutaredoxin